MDMQDRETLSSSEFVEAMSSGDYGDAEEAKVAETVDVLMPQSVVATEADETPAATLLSSGRPSYLRTSGSRSSSRMETKGCRVRI